ncbi:hypothetical protein GYMLUDRAFT_669543 [Collybiopsis luxurians FD-317 M1]|uniref:F-box domain-containing protein n=1 Tax=Collybiopsis luxurians FD-317 M1 TaxID=944289 RepID=A0A0D0CAQ4_9AGAR|nr:hypothetical protein GYMLUDRAFT_669543 [Collybiopsis luxurians FD-317 M1]
MALRLQPDITALNEVIVFKRNYLKKVKDRISDLSQKISLLDRQDQDLTERSAPPHSSLPEFQQLKATLDDHLEQAVNLEDSIALHTTLLPSPAQLLPVEILSYILFLCMEDMLFPEWGNLSFPPLVFGRVCSWFRAVALSTPLVWSSVSIHILPGRRWKDQFDSFLERSGSCPLRLELIWHPKRGDHETNMVYTILNQLMPSLSSRWQKLQLFVPDHTLSIILGNPLPTLEYLSLGSENDDPIPYLGSPGFAPTLRTLSFSTVHLRPLLWQMPWSQLTELNSKSQLSGSGVLRIFAQCRLLERCRLRVGRYNPHAFDPDPHHLVVMPRLQSLVFVIGNNEDCFGLFQRVVLPALTEMEFRSATMRAAGMAGQLFFHGESVWPKQHLVSLIERSGCTLERLALVGVLVHEMELRDTVKWLPSLTSLEYFIGGDMVPDDLKEILLKRQLGELR